LTLVENADKHTNEVSCLVVVENDLLGQLLELRAELDTAALHRRESVDVMHVRVRQSVRLASLDVVEALATLVEPEVEKILSHDFQAIKN